MEEHNVEIIGEESPPYSFHWQQDGRGGVLMGVFNKKVARSHLKKKLGKRYNSRRMTIVEVPIVESEGADTTADGQLQSGGDSTTL